jgi:hypothetical protein
MSDDPKDTASMSDSELIAEWNCIECDSENTVRTEELAAEMQKRSLDF